MAATQPQRKTQKGDDVKRSAIRKTSTKRAKEMRLYAKERDAFLREHSHCDCCTLEGKEVSATDVHHRIGRIGRNLRDQRHWIPLCRFHHDKVHAHPAWARKHDLLASAAEFNMYPG